METGNIVLAAKELCTGCSSCASICPKQCISFCADTEGFFYPVIDEESCVHCGKCETVCPVLHPCSTAQSSQPETYAAYAKDPAIRAASSSGGVFRVLADYILQEGGVVVGAAMTDNLTVEHIVVRESRELKRLQGSKYVQSSPNKVFREIQTLLDGGMQVLYSGTPCAVNGLLAFLRHPYDNLYTVDLICHGVPSELAWRKYVEQREAQSGSSAVAANFRDKSEGWRKFSLSLSFASGANYRKDLHSDLYMRAFLKNYCLRPSCYRCSAKGIGRLSDLTLGDLWGLEKVLPDWNDDLGVSVVFIQSEKGRQLLDCVQAKIAMRRVDPVKVAEHNQAMVQSVAEPRARVAFFRKLERQSFDTVVTGLMKKETRYRKAKKIFRRIKAMCKR